MKNKVKICLVFISLTLILSLIVSEIRVGKAASDTDKNIFFTLSYVDGGTYRISIGKNAEYISATAVKRISDAVFSVIRLPCIATPEIIDLTNETIRIAIKKLYAVFEQTLPENRANKTYGNAQET